MRVISGTAKGRRLVSVPGDQTRPITDRVKEALFDIIGPDVVGSTWWDVFAGTGAVGVEALSRGAEKARLTELGRAALDAIRANLEVTRLAGKAEVRRADAFSILMAAPDREFDYVFVAPPQFKGLWHKAVLAMDQNPGWLTQDGWLIVQIAPKEFSPPALTQIAQFDERRYGSTLLLFYSRKGSE